MKPYLGVDSEDGLVVIAMGSEDTHLEAHMDAHAARELAAKLLIMADKVEPGN